VIRKLKKAGFVEKRSGKGPGMKSGWSSTKQEAGQLGNRILREAGVK